MDEITMLLLLLCLGVWAVVGFFMWRTLRPKNRQAGHERVLVPPPPGPEASAEDVEEYVFQQFQKAIDVDARKPPEQIEREEREADLATGEILTRMAEQRMFGQFSKSPGPWRRRRRW